MTAAIEIAPGVVCTHEGRFAIYQGPADALIAAGVVTLPMLPGQRGNGRGMCCYEADGSQRQRGTNVREPGYTQIVAKKCSAGLVYEVRVMLTPERVEAIAAERVRASTCWPFPVVCTGGANLGSTLSPRQEARA